MQDVVGDSNFIKYFVCIHLNQNPYSDEMRSVPDIYWLTQFNFIRMKRTYEWKNLWEPQAELIGSIADPHVFQEYLKLKKAKSKANSESVETAMENPTGEYNSLMGAATNYHFDPVKGLVDSENTIVVPKDEFEKSNNIGGIAISY